MAKLVAYARRRQIEDWAGPVAGPVELQRELGIPRSTLNDWRRKGFVVGLLRGHRNHVYPVEQFVDARPLEGLLAIREAAGEWRRAWLWLRQPHARFGMEPPLAALRLGRVDEVSTAARRDLG
jgi:hypothetical protein